jgi:4-hydroxy-tetrahydrodipicolinate synthase
VKYRRNEAKDYARENLRGIWAAALTPFKPDASVDEQGLAGNLRHWTEELGIDGIFLNGKQAEAFSMRTLLGLREA